MHRTCMVEAGKVRLGVGTASCGHNREFSWRWRATRLPRAGQHHGNVTPWMTTGPLSGFSSLACETPDGVITSIAFGTVAGSTEQIRLLSPNWYGCGTDAKLRA
jgi:hypothetical protein